MSELYLNPRSVSGLNVTGLKTLVWREISRFLNVYTQTIVAPVVTTLMYYTVFALAFGGIARSVGDVPFLEFLAPGLVMMVMVQNAFANTSSSLVISKVQGNIVDLLMPPLSPLELYLGFCIGSVARGLIVGICTALVISFFVQLHIASLAVVLVYALLGTLFLGSLGLAAGIWSEKFDHIAAVTNFIVTPMTFLSGTFYVMEALPEFWQNLARYNPFYYMIDGFRAGFIGHASAGVGLGVIILLGINLVLAVLILKMLRTGYKIKH